MTVENRSLQITSLFKDNYQKVTNFNIKAF